MGESDKDYMGGSDREYLIVSDNDFVRAMRIMRRKERRLHEVNDGKVE